MTGKQRAAHEGDFVPHLTVVADVRVGHQQAAVSDDGARIGKGPAMNSDSLANGAVLADTAKAWPTLKRSILGDIADHRMRMDRTSGTDLGVAEDDGRCGDTALGANPDRPANDRVRPN